MCLCWPAYHEAFFAGSSLTTQHVEKLQHLAHPHQDYMDRTVGLERPVAHHARRPSAMLTLHFLTLYFRVGSTSSQYPSGSVIK